MESLPIEIVFGIVECLDIGEVKQLSLSSRRMRGVCLPSLFRKLTIEFSRKGFDLLESVLKSNLHKYIVSLEYICPMLLKPEIRNYRYFKTQFLTSNEYVDTCEEFDVMSTCEDWEELECFRDDFPSYTGVYKTLRRTCVEQQVSLETGRASNLMSLAFKLLPHLNELILVFCQTLGDDDWESYYLQVYHMVQQTSYGHHVQLAPAALKGHNIPLKLIQLTCLEAPDDLLPGSWDSLTTPLTELVGHAPGLRLVESGLPLALLCRVSLNIRELELCSIHMELSFIECFLQSNAQSLLSLYIHNVQVIDRGQLAPLTPVHVGDIIDLTIEREKRLEYLSCLRSAQGGWKLFFSHSSVIYTPESRKRKQRVS